MRPSRDGIARIPIARALLSGPLRTPSPSPPPLSASRRFAPASPRLRTLSVRLLCGLRLAVRGSQYAARDVKEIRPLQAVPDRGVPDTVRVEHPWDGAGTEGGTPDRSIEPQPVSGPGAGVHGGAPSHAVDGQKATLRLSIH